jgi:hypothetical protein
MNTKMSDDEKRIFLFLLNSPLTEDVKPPQWYSVLCASSRLRIAPWILDGEESTDEVREKWKNRALTAVAAEFWAEETKSKNPTWFDEESNPEEILTDYLKNKKSKRQYIQEY